MSDTPQAIDTPRSNRRNLRRIARIGLALGCALLLSLLALPVASADGGREILIRDQCDAVTFNAGLGAGTCVGNGNVTLAKFNEKLNPKDGGHRAWRFAQETLGIKVGQVVHITNTGGEPHTFTEVFTFGTGAVPPLNAAFPVGTASATPVINPDLGVALGATLVFPGASEDIAGLSAGTHRFQCLIHPWMRSVITVQNN